MDAAGRGFRMNDSGAFTLLTRLRAALPWTFALTVGIAWGCVSGIAIAQGAKPVSVWSGVYTAAQAKRGEEVHADVCAMCHGPKLNGAGQSEMPPSPAIAGSTFLRKWFGQNVAALFVVVRHTMPPDAPGTLTDQQSADAIAHMLAVSGIPAGNRELPPDPNALASIVIEAPPK
jgi:mono/diheme cytochrome c family protein